MLPNLHPLSLASFFLAVLCLIAITVLTGLHDTVPTELTTTLYVSIGAGGASGLVQPPTKA